MHLRTQIRNAIGAAVTGLPTTAHDVYVGRNVPVDPDSAPALRVFTDNDEINDDRMEMSESIEYHSLSVVIEIHTFDLTDPDALLDQVSLEVNEALLADVTLGGLSEWIRFAEYTVEQYPNLQQPATIGTVTYAVDYRVDGRDLETPIP